MQLHKDGTQVTIKHNANTWQSFTVGIRLQLMIKVVQSLLFYTGSSLVPAGHVTNAAT